VQHPHETKPADPDFPGPTAATAETGLIAVTGAVAATAPRPTVTATPAGIVDAACAEDERADVARAAAGDPGAFERLYRRHVGRVYSLARRMLGEEEAEDATQEVFVRAWTKLDRFHGDSAFGTWLYRLAVNALLGRRNTLTTRRARFEAAAADAPLPATRPVRVDLRVDFDAALERLPKGARQVFVLHDVEGYTHEEIGGMLAVTTGTSKSQLHRARMALREYLA
jgi:RNA polymerase sigma-70 factor, ECF subfamily